MNDLSVVWIYSGSFVTALDSATWLKSVQELRNLGWRVTLVAVGLSGYQQICGVEVLCIPRTEIYLLRQVTFHIRVLWFILQQFTAIDLILFHELSAPWILPLQIVRSLTGNQRPALVMDTRSLPMTPADTRTWKAKVRKGVYLIANYLGNYFADGRLAITERMAQAVQIPSEKLWGTWPSGADRDHFALVRTKRCWPQPDDAIHLIHHGSLHHERNLMTLCRAVVLANEKGMSFELSLVGSGTARAELEEFAAKSNCSISVVPPVPFEKIPDVLAQAHVGVLPFPDEEKFQVSSPIKLFEYMASGLPIMVTRITCHSDVVCDGEYAFWAETANEQGLLNALCLIWRSRNLLSEKGRQASLAGEGWTWTGSAEKLKKALEKGFESFLLSMDSSNG